MKGKILAISWIVSVVIVWLVIAFLFAQISATPVEGLFIGFLTNVYVIGLSLFFGSFVGICIYGQYSEAVGHKKREEEKKRKKSMGETTL